MYIWLRAFIGSLILILLIYFFDIREVLIQFHDLNSKYLFLVGLVILCSTIVGAIGMFLIVSREDEILFSRFLPIYWTSWSFGLVIPGQVGDVASISLLLKRLGFEWSVILARSLVDKVITLLIMFAFAIYGLLNVAHMNIFHSEMIKWLVVAVLFFVVIILLKRKLFEELVKNKTLGVFKFIRKTLDEITYTISSYPIRVVANFLLTIIKVAFIGSAYWFMFRALGYKDINLWIVIPLVAASSLVAYLPISLNGIGTVEFAGILLFSSVGISEPSVLSAFLLMRIIVLLLAWLPTGFILFFSGQAASKILS